MDVRLRHLPQNGFQLRRALERTIPGAGELALHGLVWFCLARGNKKVSDECIIYLVAASAGLAARNCNQGDVRTRPGKQALGRNVVLCRALILAAVDAGAFHDFASALSAGLQRQLAAKAELKRPTGVGWSDLGPASHRVTVDRIKLGNISKGLGKCCESVTRRNCGAAMHQPAQELVVIVSPRLAGAA